MAIYYQHIGRPLWVRDAPKSLGTVTDGVMRFHLGDIGPYIEHILPSELANLSDKVGRFASDGFQVWGLPEGAARVISNMGDGDFLMLLESDEFLFFAQVLHKVSEPCRDLSEFIWGEGRFPRIVILQGEMIRYPWEQFCMDFSFAPGYHMQGNTMRLARERLAASKWGSEEAFAANLITSASIKRDDVAKDFKLFASRIEAHLRQVKIRVGQQNFRRDVFALHGAKCSFCSISINAVLDAAHIVSKESEGTDDPRNGIPLCAVHHRLFDAGYVGINPLSREILATGTYELNEMNVTQKTLLHNGDGPAEKALDWRWKHPKGTVGRIPPQ